MSTWKDARAVLKKLLDERKSLETLDGLFRQAEDADRLLQEAEHRQRQAEARVGDLSQEIKAKQEWLAKVKQDITEADAIRRDMLAEVRAQIAAEQQEAQARVEEMEARVQPLSDDLARLQATLDQKRLDVQARYDREEAEHRDRIKQLTREADEAASRLESLRREAASLARR